MKDVRDVARNGNTVWAATSGGLFSWQDGSPTFSLYTNAEGLSSMDLTAVAVDSAGNVWSGSSSGMIHVFNPSQGTWRYISDIATSPQTNKRINRLVIYGDTVLVCSDFGLSMFFRSGFRFGDTYTRFGTSLANTRVSLSSAAVFAGRLWASVSAGASSNYVASASLSVSNLLPPESWTLSTTGQTTTATQSLALFNNRLYAGTTGGMYVLQGDTTWVPIDSLAGKNVVAAAGGLQRLLLCTADRSVYLMDSLQTVTRYGADLPFPPTSVIAIGNDDPVVGSSGGGVLRFSSAWDSHVPNGPNSNQFISVTVDQNGTVWGASGYSGNGKGFYRYNGSDWKSFTVENSGLPTNDYFRVSTGCNGSVWASSWARGVVEIPGGADRVDSSHIFGSNVGMVGLTVDPSYIVVGTVLCDDRGSSWMSVNAASDQLLLSIRRPDGSWIRLPVKSRLGYLTTLLDNIPLDRSFALDAFGNVWAISRDATFRGVISFGRGSGDRDSIMYLLNDTNVLPSNDVKTIVIDRENDMWVGTDKGIAIILDTDNPLRSGAIASYRPLTGLSINTIAVDALNQKWVGTSEGVIVLSQDGTQQVAVYTVENTGGKLIDNDVKSIAIDFKTGTVYFGSTNGLASLTTAGSAPRAAFDKLALSPNPYVLPNAIPLTVDGLVENSSIKILAIDGHLVRSIATPGGRIGFWDGKDESGRDVASGVYIVVAYSEDGSKVATGKVAVIRR